MDQQIILPSLPAVAGIGYKPQHFADIQQNAAPVGWFEIHAENDMGDGGRPLAQLRALAQNFAVSVHGVGLSIGGQAPLDIDHLARLKSLCDWVQPASFSEHLAWSTHDGAFLNDLLPLPYTEATLAQVCDHIDQIQNTLGRQMLLENPSTYLAFAETTLSEVDFLAQIAARTGCGLLLDINNVYVSAVNQATDPMDYLRGFPLHAVGEIHLGGHEVDVADYGAPLLIDSHSRAVAAAVWQLYQCTIDLAGPKPTLIEWDNDVPDWHVLQGEADKVSQILSAARAPQMAQGAAA